MLKGKIPEFVLSDHVPAAADGVFLAGGAMQAPTSNIVAGQVQGEAATKTVIVTAERGIAQGGRQRRAGQVTGVEVHQRQADLKQPGARGNSAGDSVDKVVGQYKRRVVTYVNSLNPVVRTRLTGQRV